MSGWVVAYPSELAASEANSDVPAFQALIKVLN
jgi:hypothetical protein